ncbi:hypothetical protein N0V83_002526 [Neocucurbitaria cava]|uniref:Major facilitator superfamily (MFS) profile domain-containing protein n=1 Tax=Neocucurbitaria cava TaxID=798079 RepID=A0A9W9CPK9_9PLEO|nr:hypothetical protein N0V83_002526 [Neocucurbitaria cava]
MAGAAIQVMEALGRPIAFNEASQPPIGNTWLFGFLVGAPFIFGAPIGLLITDRLTEIWLFGRRGAICVAGLFSLASVVGSASVHEWHHLLVFRILLGAGMAGKASIVPVLLSETSPKNVRGILLVCWQLFVAFGLAAGSVANMSVFHLNEEESWRYMFIAAFIPALLLFSLVLFSPESPRWLLKKSGQKYKNANDLQSQARVRGALKSLTELHNEPTDILAAGELVLLYKRLIEEQQYFDISHSFSAATERTVDQTEHRPHAPRDEGRENHERNTEGIGRVRSQSALDEVSHPATFAGTPERDALAIPIRHVSWRLRWRLMFKKGRMRRSNYAASAVMLSQQICGINLLAFLAESFFRNSVLATGNPTLSEKTELLGFSLAFGLWNFLSTIPSLFFIDQSEGRRTLLNWSFPGMAVSLLISALILLAPLEDPSKGKATDVVAAMHFLFIAAFTTAYSIGEGTGGVCYLSGSIPARQ